jgi:hypothetical protein
MRTRWRITEMSEWGRDFLDMEVKAFIELEQDGNDQFQFGLVRGIIDYRSGERDGRPAVEWTWEGNDACDPVMGLGWAVLVNKGTLLGRLFIHQGDSSSFRAEKATARTKSTRSRKNR